MLKTILKTILWAEALLGVLLFGSLVLIVWYMFRTGRMVIISGIERGPEPVDPLLERDRKRAEEGSPKASDP